MTGQAPRFSVSRWVLGTYYTNLMIISSTHLRNMLTKQQNIDIKKMKKKLDFTAHSVILIGIIILTQFQSRVRLET